MTDREGFGKTVIIVAGVLVATAPLAPIRSSHSEASRSARWHPRGTPPGADSFSVQCSALRLQEEPAPPLPMLQPSATPSGPDASRRHCAQEGARG